MRPKYAGFAKLDPRLLLTIRGFRRSLAPMERHPYRIAALVSLAWAFAGFVGGSYETAAQSAQPVSDITFTRNIAPVLQRSCQRCHRPDGGAPMPLITYEQVRPWARSIKTRTGLGPHAGVMPPWFVEKNIGIQGFKQDPSLSDAEIAMIAKWVDGGAPRGNAADMPKALDFDNADKWQLGEPDLIVRSPEVMVPAIAP